MSEEKKGNYFPEERYEQKLWDISVAPSSNGEQGLAGIVLSSLPQSLRQGLRGRGLLLTEQEKHSHVLDTLGTQKCDASRQGKASRAPPVALPSHPLCQVCLAPAATVSDATAALASDHAEPVLFTKGNFTKKHHQDFFWLSKVVQQGFSTVKALFPGFSSSSRAGFATQ